MQSTTSFDRWRMVGKSQPCMVCDLLPWMWLLWKKTEVTKLNLPCIASARLHGYHGCHYRQLASRQRTTFARITVLYSSAAHSAYSCMPVYRVRWLGPMRLLVASVINMQGKLHDASRACLSAPAASLFSFSPTVYARSCESVIMSLMLRTRLDDVVLYIGPYRQQV